MKLLAIDTSGVACAACVYDAGSQAVLASCREDIGKGHAERLMQDIGRVMSEAGIGYGDLGRIAVCTGPGSFTGIRVGVATARGFGLGLGIPVIGVSLLEALLAEIPGEAAFKAGAVLTTTRDEVYAQFTFGTPFAEAGEPFVIKATALAEASVVREPGLVLVGSGVSAIAAIAGIDNASNASNSVDIGTIARIAASKKIDGKRPEPLYLRKPDAKPQHGFSVQRS